MERKASLKQQYQEASSAIVDAFIANANETHTELSNQAAVTLGKVPMPGVIVDGSIIFGPRSQERQFVFSTKMDALDRKWPADRHLQIESQRRRLSRIPVIGEWIGEKICNKLHDQMVENAERNRARASTVRFY